jgi:hypothetical protein
MRQGQSSKRSRGRGGGRRNVSPRHQNFDSNGPSIRIRGNAHQVYEKYLQLARDANAAGDRIMAENMYQHAEHYFRILNVDDGEGFRNNRGNGNDPRYSDRQDSGDDQPQMDDSDDYGSDQDNGDNEPEQPSHEPSRQNVQGNNDEVNGGRRQPRRPRQRAPRNAAPSNGDGDPVRENRSEAEVIVERVVPVEAAQPDSDSAEERSVD